MYRKRLAPSSAPQSDTPQSVVPGEPQPASDKSGKYRKREAPQPTPHHVVPTSAFPPPLGPEELPDAPATPPTSIATPAPTSILGRIFGGAVTAACILLGVFLLLQVIQTVAAITALPLWAAIPMWLIIALALGYTVFSAAALVVRLFRLRKFRRHIAPGGSSGSEAREHLKTELLQQLKLIRGNTWPADSGIPGAIDRLSSNNIGGAGTWLEIYRSEVLPLLKGHAHLRVQQIAVAAGTSAALSPWRLFDVFIAINACCLAAQEVLCTFGRRPDNPTIVAMAFDALMATFLAAAAEDWTADAAEQLSEQIGSSVGHVLLAQIAPRIAQGVAVGYFVRRLGRRMVRTLSDA
jgi:uncharacterized membrane protein YcjF (UPF0283 family)